jgi:methionyl-tRNA formyltransferase
LIRPEELRVVFMGTPDFAMSTLEGLIASGVNLCGVFTQPDRPKGRGKQLAAPPIKELALRHDIPVFQPTRLRNPEAVEQVRELKPDLVVVVAYGQILPQSVLDIPRFGCINVHASLLPKYRGAAPINKCIVDGETETGVTTMMMDVGLDTGDMLIKRSLNIGPNETAGELHDRLAPMGREALEETLQLLCAGKLIREVQDDALSNYAPMMKKEDGLIDWSLSAVAIHNQVRGLSPWPGAYTHLDGVVLKLAETSVTAGESDAGTVLAAVADGVVVACGEGALRVGALQLPGKKRLPAAEFVKGRSLALGTMLGGAGAGSD